MTEKELMSELRSLRSDIGEYSDRLVQLRLEDFKSAFAAQMRDLLAEEGRRTIGSGLSQAGQSSDCALKAACHQEIISKIEGAIEMVKREDQSGAMGLLDGIETTICGDSSPCLDGGCSAKALETIHDVKALLSAYFALRPKLFEGGNEIVHVKGKVQDVEFSSEDAEKAIAPLSNSWRVTILRMLSHNERTMSEIGKALNMKTGHLQFHMRTLKDAGYIASDRRRRTYSITEKGEKAMKGLTELMASLG
jgi:DNA-binding HxlR family transcriptional regulator